MVTKKRGDFEAPASSKIPSGRPHNQLLMSLKYCCGLVIEFVYGLVAERIFVKIVVRAGAVCKLTASLVQLSTS